MKKYLPIIILVVGVLFFIGIIFFIKSRNSTPPPVPEVEEEVVKDIPQDMRPLASLVPSSDGHWLTLTVVGINLPGVQSSDYELLYTVKDGRTQGVPGTVKGNKDLERKILLGSESSGKFRYDEGVETGTLTLRFRDSNGKLLGKLSTDFHLQTNTKDLSSADKSFTYSLPKLTRGVFYLTMDTFSAKEIPGAIARKETLAIFASSK